MADIRAYRPEEKSLSSGQVLHCPYPYEKTKIIVREMAEAMALELVAKNLVTNQVVLTIGYDTDNLKKQAYRGSVTTDRYGRKVPKHAHGTENLSCYTASGKLITDSTLALFERIINRDLLVRRVTIAVSHLQAADEVCNEPPHKQLDLFTDYTVQAAEAAALNAHLEKEKSLQQTMLTIKEKYGKNAILKGTNLQESATGQSRNRQIGGHKDIAKSCSRLIEKGLPVVVVTKADFSKALGICLRGELPPGYPFICFDGIDCRRGNYIDIGVPVAGGKAVPVVVKTLVFGGKDNHENE